MVQTDVTDAASVAAMVDRTVEAFGVPSILVNNAGINVFHEPLQTTDAEWRRCFSVDLEAAWTCARAVLPAMLESGGGNIVNIASCHSFKIIPHTFPYPVAKHALVGLTRALGIEYAARGIRVNAIAPGYIETPIAVDYWNSFPDPEKERQRACELHPPRRIGRPEEVAWTAVFLASDEAPFINAETIVIDGGRSVLYHE
jgi:NAD(P)-dependent dehydrogenase (short-subunit alcohol dehydrogenase family)